MTNFVLITMMCFRVCTPVQAEMFVNKAACEKARQDYTRTYNTSAYCAPLVKTQ